MLELKRVSRACSMSRTSLCQNLLNPAVLVSGRQFLRALMWFSPTEVAV
jgi:hypothetical protein